jgi:hypothetical protein
LSEKTKPRPLLRAVRQKGALIGYPPQKAPRLLYARKKGAPPSNERRASVFILNFGVKKRPPNEAGAFLSSIASGRCRAPAGDESLAPNPGRGRLCAGKVTQALTALSGYFSRQRSG